LDDQIGDLLDSIDLERNIVVITGDHGESFGEDGKWLHSSRLSTWQTRVPMLVLGAGVPARTVDTPTLHMDIAPTLLHAVTGAPPELPHLAGHDMLTVATDPRDVLLVNVDGQHMVLISESGRLHLMLDPSRTTLTSLGFHDEAGTFRSLATWDPGPVENWLAKVEAKLNEVNP
jgi:membrane-anchored protein YejM (alkaline phosphatase superfamily)